MTNSTPNYTKCIYLKSTTKKNMSLFKHSLIFLNENTCFLPDYFSDIIKFPIHVNIFNNYNPEFGNTARVIATLCNMWSATSHNVK